jgi:hypothetical protein
LAVTFALASNSASLHIDKSKDSSVGAIWRIDWDDPAVTKLLGLGDSSLLERCVAIGAFCAGAIGGIAGLVVGVVVHWQTAWFAIFEVGIPAGIVGGLLGVITALLITAFSRATRTDTAPD